MATLTISHYIYLNREQRYKVHSGESIEVIGISVPVWFHRGTTSEPAKEVFCKYKITNESTDKNILPTKEGYYINLPQKTELEKNNLSEELKEITSIKMGTSDRLLDLKDGGTGWLEFRQYNKIEEGENKYNLIHFVEIKPDELLQDTMS
jgi:hypothetical protein